MPSKTFEGKDETDLEKQIWDWKSVNPRIKLAKRNSTERLPLKMNKITRSVKINSPNLVSIRIDYEESN
jgi:hypothetical protein